MAKITDLVKTYRMLSDPKAPDWNVKFIGAVAVVAIVVSAGAGALLWSGAQHDGPASVPAASVDAPDAEDPCVLPAGAPADPHVAAECADASPPVLP